MSVEWVQAPGRGRLGGSTPFGLRDGAKLVPIVESDGIFDGMTAYRSAAGSIYITMCYCGPEAPLPGKYQETVVQDFPFPGYRQFKITEHDPMSDRTREFQQSFSPSHVAIFGIRRLWWHVRDAYVAYIFAPTYRAIEYEGGAS